MTSPTTVDGSVADLAGLQRQHRRLITQIREQALQADWVARHAEDPLIRAWAASVAAGHRVVLAAEAGRADSPVGQGSDR